MKKIKTKKRLKLQIYDENHHDLEDEEQTNKLKLQKIQNEEEKHNWRSLHAKKTEEASMRKENEKNSFQIIKKTICQPVRK